MDCKLDMNHTVAAVEKMEADMEKAMVRLPVSKLLVDCMPDIAGVEMMPDMEGRRNGPVQGMATDYYTADSCSQDHTQYIQKSGLR